jgi:hypothetical protein
VNVPLLPGSRPHWLVTISHQPSTLRSATSRLSCNGSCFSAYSFGMDCTENTASNSYSLVGWHYCLRGPYRKHCSSVACAIIVALMSCLLWHDLVMALSSNYSSFQWTCYNMFTPNQNIPYCSSFWINLYFKLSPNCYNCIETF